MRINRGAGYGLEILVEYVFNGNEKALQWAKKNLDNIDANVNKKVGRCLKYKFECVISNFWFLFCFSSSSATGRYIPPEMSNRDCIFISANGRCPLLMSAILRLFHKEYIVVHSGLQLFVRYLEMSAIRVPANWRFYCIKC